eukprot:3090889-Lingulodinium_polyedra.AAC.1
MLGAPLYNELKNVRAQCPACIKIRKKSRRRHAKTPPLERGYLVGDVMHMEGGDTYFIVKDRFSKVTYIEPLPH